MEGGIITVDSAVCSAVYADNRSNPDGVDRTTIRDLTTRGAVSPDSVAAYGINTRGVNGGLFSNINSSGFSGSIVDNYGVANVIENLYTDKEWYHPSLEAGGYGVLLNETNGTLINGVYFQAGPELHRGRHALYVSNTPGGPVTPYGGCENVIATNFRCIYRDRDDRNMPPFAIRKTCRLMLSSNVIAGANGGVVYNPQQGDIERSINNGLCAQIVKYAGAPQVAAIGQISVPNFRVRGWLDTALNISVFPKDDTVTKTDCTVFSMYSVNGRLSNVVSSVPNASSPYLIYDGCQNISIDGILDYLAAADTDPLAPLITFTGTGAGIDNIKISGINTRRKIFGRLTTASLVTNITVDWPRIVALSIATGAASKVDDDELVSTITVAAQTVTLNFRGHVTQAAINALNLQCMASGTPVHVFIVSTGNKQLIFRAYDFSGNPVDFTTASNVQFRVILTS